LTQIAHASDRPYPAVYLLLMLLFDCWMQSAASFVCTATGWWPEWQMKRRT